MKDPIPFKIYKASAGAGKTYTLVRTYLSISLDAPDAQLSTKFGSILAITFTNKAASEMKSRILEHLREMELDGARSSMACDLAADLSVDPSEIVRRAHLLHKSILHHYSDLSVCTIDSFMHRVVRTFAHDLNLPVNFNVQIDSDDIIKGAVNELMAKIGEDAELTQLITTHAESQLSDDKNPRMIEEELLRLAQETFHEDAPDHLKMLKGFSSERFLSLQQRYLHENKAFEESLRPHAQAVFTAMKAESVTPDDLPHRSKGSIANYFQRIVDGDYSKLTPSARIEGLRDRKGKALPDKVRRVIPTILQSYDAIRALCDNELQRYQTRQALLAHLLPLALMNRLYESIRSYSTDNELLHISEFNKQINAVVENQPMPFLYERLGNRYSHFLIDEFQDTSRMQWHNLVPLLENGVAQGQLSMVVGDAKQAIYRFRQGDVRQFVDLPQVKDSIHGASLSRPGGYQNKALPVNRRSSRTIVDFNNRFFRWAIDGPMANHPLLPKLYQELEQDILTEGGHVQLHMLEAEEMMHTLRQQIQHYVNELGYRYRDIAVITPRTDLLVSAANQLTAADKGESIPLVSAESFLLSSSPVVSFLRQMLHALQDPDDRQQWFVALSMLQPFGMLPDNWIEQFQEAKGMASLMESLSIDCPMNLEGTLYDSIEQLIRAFHLEGCDSAYVATLLNFVSAYSQRHRQDLGEFLTEFDKQFSKLSTSTAGDLDAVQLLTIHKAKGLEAPIVFVLFAKRREPNKKLWVTLNDPNLELPVGWVSPSNDRSTLFDDARDAEKYDQEMDRFNLLYVALTRPREKLVILCDTQEQHYKPLLQGFAQSEHGPSTADKSLYLWGKDLSKAELQALRQANTPAEPSKPSQQMRIQPEKVTLHNISYPTWENRILVADSTKQQAPTLPQERGLKMHALLSGVRQRGDEDQALTDYQSQHPDITDAEAAELQAAIQQFLSRPDVAPYFEPHGSQWEVKIETPLLYQGRELRPDRIVFTPEDTIVIDFKTGQPNLTNQQQINTYVQAIASMGYPNVRGELLYL